MDNKSHVWNHQPKLFRFTPRNRKKGAHWMSSSCWKHQAATPAESPYWGPLGTPGDLPGPGWTPEKVMDDLLKSDVPWSGYTGWIGYGHHDGSWLICGEYLYIVAYTYIYIYYVYYILYIYICILYIYYIYIYYIIYILYYICILYIYVYYIYWAMLYIYILGYIINTMISVDVYTVYTWLCMGFSEHVGLIPQPSMPRAMFMWKKTYPAW